MAKRKKSELGEIKDVCQYRVTLKDVITIGDDRFYPGTNIVFRGDIVKQFEGMIEHANEV